jgi:hypothetical protein
MRLELQMQFVKIVFLKGQTNVHVCGIARNNLSVCGNAFTAHLLL